MHLPISKIHMGVFTETLRVTLRDLTASEARLRVTLRDLTVELTTPSPDEIQAAIRLLEANGYEVQKR